MDDLGRRIHQRALCEIGVAAVLVSVFHRGIDAAPVLRVTDGYTIAAAVLTRTNTIGRTRALCRSYLGHSGSDFDAAATPIIATADAGATRAASGGDGAAADSDVTASIIVF